MHAKYIEERMGDSIIETDKGYITYRYLNDGKTVYIVDLYVLPEYRQDKVASGLADFVADLAKDKGAVEMFGTVDPRAKNPTDNLKVLLGYGMTLVSSSNEMILFRKDI